MSKPMYSITEELRDIFSIVEEEDGELTPELEARLNIAEDEYENKIMSYFGAIQERKAQNNMIKDEIERLNRMAASNVKVETKLKSRILGAVTEFGYLGKTGNMKLDLETLKLWTVSKDKVIIDNEDTFNDPRFCSTTLNIPSDSSLVQKVFEFASSVCTDKDFMADLNKELKIKISRKKLKDALDLGVKVKGAYTENNHFVVMR